MDPENSPLEVIFHSVFITRIAKIITSM